VRENPVNQSGSVALSAEEVRGPPQTQVIDKNIIFDPTKQGVVGSSPAGRAKMQGLGNQNQVLLFAVGPLWDLLSTAPQQCDRLQALSAQNQVLRSTAWNCASFHAQVRLLGERPVTPFACRSDSEASWPL
jgi:hypothetical protein